MNFDSKEMEQVIVLRRRQCLELECNSNRPRSLCTGSTSLEPKKTRFYQFNCRFGQLFSLDLDVDEIVSLVCVCTG